jgi:hypothetical protein
MRGSEKNLLTRATEVPETGVHLEFGRTKRPKLPRVWRIGHDSSALSNAYSLQLPDERRAALDLHYAAHRRARAAIRQTATTLLEDAMNRICYRTLGAALTLGSLLIANVAAAEEPLTGPSLETKGKPLSPEGPTSTIPKLVGVSVMAGGMAASMGAVNDRLTGAGYPNKLPIAFPILGGQAFALFGRFLVGGSGAALLARSVDAPNGGRVSASGAWGTFDFGYQLVRVNGFLVAPVLSLGSYGMAMNIASKADTSFDDAVRTPTRSTTLTNNGALGGISLVAKMIVVGRNAHLAQARSGFSLGLRVGGLYGIPFSGWHADGAKATGGPPFGLRGGYAALSLGVGTW